MYSPGNSDIRHPSSRPVYRSQIKGQYEENYSEMEDIVYCISTKEFIVFWVVAALNLLSVSVMCYVTRRQCIRDECLV